MPLNMDDNKANFQIRGFIPGTIKINDQTFTHSVIVTPATLITDWQPQSLAALTAAHFQTILEIKPHILLIGTGAELIFPDIAIYGQLINSGIGVEIMSTSAACRTYNALTAENRNVAAALLLQ